MNFANVLDFESKSLSRLEMQIDVTDSGEPALSATAAVSVQTLDSNEPPRWTIPSATVLATIDENSKGGVRIGQELSTLVEDLDAADKLIFSFDNLLACDDISILVECNSADDTGIDVISWFEIDEGTGLITLTRDALLDHESQPKIMIKVRATDSGLGNLYSVSTMFILVNDMPEAPQFAPLHTPVSIVNRLAQEYLSFSVNEYVPIGTVVVPGATLNSFVYDYDNGDSFTFSQVFGSQGEAESVTELTDLLRWNDDTQLATTPFWLAEEGVLRGWFGSSIDTIESDLSVPYSSERVRISLRYWSMGTWDSSDNEEASVSVNGIVLWSKRRTNPFECDGWNDLGGLSLTAAGCFQDVEVEVDVSKETKWQCVDSINVPVRMNKYGDLECYSQSNKHCMWGACSDAANVNAATHQETSLSCGAEHKEKWGKSGYQHKDHWCNKGRKFLSTQSTTSLKVSVSGTIKDTSGSARWGVSRINIVSGGRDIGNEQPVFKVTSTGAIITTRPLVYNDASSHAMSIEVEDSAGLTARAIATILVNDINQAPVWTSNLYVLSVPENSIGGIAPVPVSGGGGGGGVIQARDADQHQALTYSADVDMTPLEASLFSVTTMNVNGESIATILVRDNVDLDYERRNNYTLALLVTDSEGSTASSTVTIYLTDVNEPPLPATDTLSFWVRGSTNQATVGSAITPNDPDADDEHDIVILSWGKCTSNCDSSPIFTPMALDAIPFAIDESKFTLFVPSYVDASSAIDNLDRFELLVIVEDMGGYLKTVTVDVQVTFNNNAPTAIDQIINVPENTNSFAVVGIISAVDEDTTQSLSCNITGGSPSISQQIFSVENLFMTNTGTTTLAGTVYQTNVVVGDLETLNMTINYEQIQSYELQLVFFDDYEEPLHASALLIIQITDVNEPPEVSLFGITRSVAENSKYTLVGGPIPVHDPEGQSLVFSITNKASVPFTIDSATGQLTTTSLNSAPFLNFEYISNFDVQIDIVDVAGSHTVSTTVRVTLEDVNEPPTIDTVSLDSMPRSISEFITDTNAVVGESILAHDPEGTELRFSISSSPTDNIFSITNAGMIVVENPSNLDYEDLATLASTMLFRATNNMNLEGTFAAGTKGCNGYLECQFVNLDRAIDFCSTEPDCTGIMYDTTNTVANCERGFGCYYPRTGEETSSYTGRTSYMKMYQSDPLAKLTVTVRVSDGQLQDTTTFDLQIEDANDIVVSAISNLDPELYNQEVGDEASFSTAGGDLLYIYGYNFGPKNSAIATAVAVRYGGNLEYEATSCIVYESNTVIRCVSAPGVGRELPWSVTVGSFTADDSGTATFSYSVPTITSSPSVEAEYSEGIQGRCLNDDGNESNSDSERFLVGSDNACRQHCTLCSISATCETCLAYDWNVQSSMCQLYTTIKTFATGQPGVRCYQKLASTSTLAFRTVGGDPFSLTGKNFGPVGTIVFVFYGPVNNPMTYGAQQCQVTISHIRITCVSAPGVGSNLAVILSVSGQTAQPANGLLSYANPIIEDIAASPSDGSSELIDVDLMPPQDLPTSGGTLVDITGLNFPPLDANVDVETVLYVTYGPTGSDFNAVNCIILHSGFVIRCEVAPGYGAKHHWRVKVGGLRSDLSTVSTSYRGPSINSCFGPACQKGSTAGAQLLVLFGQNLFGPLEFASYGKTGTEYKAMCTAMKAHTALACLTSPGTGTNHRWQIRIGEQTSELTPALSGYAPPALNTLTGEGSFDSSTLGGQIVRISGSNFPPTGSTLESTNTIVTYTNGIQTFVAAGCELAYEDSFSSQGIINCKTVASTGGKLQWDISVDGQVSTAPTTSTAPPIVNSIKGYDVEDSTTEGGTEFSLIGTEFGPVGLSFPNIEVTYGPTATEYTAVGCTVTHVEELGENSTITCASAEGSGRDLAMIVTVTGQESDIYISSNGGVLFSYAPPAILAISATVVNTGSAREIQLFGRNFGELGANTTITFGGGKVGQIRHVSHVELRFVVPDWQIGRQKSIVVTVNSQISNAIFLDFNPPVIYDIGQSTEYTSLYSGTTIYIEGASFGASSSTGKVLIDGLPCVINTWTHTHIECETLDLEGELQIIVGGQASKVVDDFSVQKFLIRPAIASMSIYTGSPVGGYLVTLIGTDFADETVSTVTIGKNLCKINSMYPGSLHEDTRITCLMPPGNGRVNVTVNVEWRTSEPTFFEYTNPIIDMQMASDYKTLGGALVTLRGRHLGDASIVWWDGEVSVDTKGTSIGVNGSHVSYNATYAFCNTGCMDKKMMQPCTHPSCMSCQWYLTNYCSEDHLFGDAHDEQLCSEQCVASGFSLGSQACQLPLLRVIAQCPSQLTNKSDIVIVNQSATEVNFIAPPGRYMYLCFMFYVLCFMFYFIDVLC